MFWYRFMSLKNYLRNAFIAMLYRSVGETHCREDGGRLALSLSAMSGLCGHRYVMLLKAFCKM